MRTRIARGGGTDEGQQVVDRLEPVAVERAKRLLGVQHANEETIARLAAEVRGMTSAFPIAGAIVS